jgi:hypothetical protein
MNDPNWAEVAIAIATIVLALTGIFALSGWRSVRKSQRTDECVSAGHALAGAIGRCMSLKRAPPKANWNPEQDVWRAYDLVWSSWRRFDEAFSAVRRYYREKKLPPGIPEDIKRKLYEFEDILQVPWAEESASGEQARKIAKDIDDLLRPLRQL